MGLPIAQLRAELEAIKKIIPPSGKEAVLGIVPFRRQGEDVAQFEIRAMMTLLPFMSGEPGVRLLIHTDTREDERATFAACSPAVRDALQAVAESFQGSGPLDPARRVQDEAINPLS